MALDLIAKQRGERGTEWPIHLADGNFRFCCGSGRAARDQSLANADAETPSRAGRSAHSDYLVLGFQTGAGADARGGDKSERDKTRHKFWL